MPIMTNLTNLCLDKSSDKRLAAIKVFFEVLESGLSEFDLPFWQEILSQVVFPMLEDIDLAIQNSSRRNDESEADFYLKTVFEMVQGFNDFLVAHLSVLS